MAGGRTRLRWFAALLLWPCLAQAAPVAPVAPTTGPAISIVIDDLGDRWAEGSQVADLPGPVACAFLPESHFTPRLAARAHQAGKEVLLHLPLAPMAGKPHPLALALGHNTDERDARLVRALASVPHASGVNNHQGSLLTERREAMDWLMGRLKDRGELYFIDSYTTPLSVAYPAARARGVPATRRQVFLDDQRDLSAIRAEFRRLIKLARAQGTALAIGHPYPETIRVLRDELPKLAAQGIRLVSPSELIRLQERRSPIRVRTLKLRLTTALFAAPALEPPAVAGASAAN